MVRNTQHRGRVGRKSTHNTRIERFWREYNVNVMINSKYVFEILDSLGHKATDDSTDLLSFYYSYMCLVNKRT